jgi:ribose 5-phosphate isomerase B
VDDIEGWAGSFGYPFPWSNIMKIGFANDHAGYDLKERLKAWAIAGGHEVVDFGSDGLASVDYPDFVRRAVVGMDKWEYLILICGSGLGMSMAANRYTNIRCALVTSTEHAKLAREHNNANAIALGQWLTDPLQAEYYLKTFLETPFLGLQHEKRVRKLTNPV